ncbi:hypothetical protein JHD50_07835 [Sulfurimonas sp. MAG313]|nr:hypothetical protein [Sulfurimonas sp. MAG313]MDF1881213.1 hypothetical protein [Sulfurimonas sp. MAG313]
MCGVSGFVNMPEGIIPSVLNALKHRGPDTQSSVNFDNVSLLHTRLAIQDVLHAQQPMHFNEFTLVFNGEIYNHLELREELQEFSFSTSSDTETLLHLLIKFKEKAFAKLDGMFAFCLFDKKNRTMLFGRDRAGKKPLYYFQEGEKFLFCV